MVGSPSSPRWVYLKKNRFEHIARGNELEKMMHEAKTSFESASRDRVRMGEEARDDAERETPPATKQQRTAPALAPWLEPPAAAAAPAPAPAPLPYPTTHNRAGGRRSIFTYDQKQWIYTQHQIRFGRNATSTAPSGILREILSDGQASAELPQEATVDNVREVIRPLFR